MAAKVKTTTLHREGQIRTANSLSPMGKKLSAKGDSGVYGAHPNLPQYKQDVGIIPIKFAEDMPTTKRGMNPMRTASTETRKRELPKPSRGGVGIKTSKNTYRRAIGTGKSSRS